ncbi:High-affinity nicotinic acid transporter [Didymosphaeria variabile]|uniref:High-affinity nicotinic acid transporter n=1 Tax=Didymosphaeria variabile TaxID=1932322 RepID=A0A9W8XTC3_9PLEO|nr:High-affinity nicotinic acid transporter [Didymosphaeria variabile]KAJ4357778.1 High-affinity nicotinic acid transporter [Didymosphaeria variabile]
MSQWLDALSPSTKNTPICPTTRGVPPYDANYDDDAPDLVVCPPHTTERKLITKIDLHVIPFLCIMYLLAFLDRVNIANANVFGLSTELGLVKTKYNNALVIFFVPYILFEIPSNIVLKKLKPRVWLSICMFGFGLVTMLQGLVQDYSGLLATRFFLGVFETGMFPGAFYLIGMWYRRKEAQKRYSFFFSSTTLAGAFGGLLASAIGKMDGMRGYAGWRWIFILEGTLTCVVSFFFFFLLPNFPEEVKWLTDEERDFVQARLRIDQGRSARERPIKLADVGRVFKDPKIIVGGFMYFGLIVPAYGYAYFSPAIIQSYGYSKIQTQLHSVPPWAAAFGFAMTVAWFSDRLKHRFLFCIFPICVAIAGFAILISVHNNRELQYAALFLVAMGCYTAMPVIVCWFNMNLGGHHRRAIGSAWQVGFGNIGKSLRYKVDVSPSKAGENPSCLCI